MLSTLTLLHKIGKGSFGQVYKAKIIKTDLIVAIKVIPFSTDYDDDIDDIINEVRLLSTLNSPNIIHFISSFVEDNCACIVMEYCALSAKDLVNSTTLEEANISLILRQLLNGLDYIHKLNKIHRDIKCANILLTDQGVVKLADFGVSSEITATITKKNTFIGSPFWMSPEVILKSRYNMSADIWSTGITSIELATGSPPRSNLHPMRVLFIIPQEEAPKLPDSYSASFRSFVSDCLNKRANKRPSANDLLKHEFILMYSLKSPIDLVEIIRHVSKNQVIDSSIDLAFKHDKPTQESWNFTDKSSRKLGRGVAFAEEFDDRPFIESVAKNTKPVVKNDLVDGFISTFNQIVKLHGKEFGKKVLDGLNVDLVKVVGEKKEMSRKVNPIQVELVKRWTRN